MVRKLLGFSFVRHYVVVAISLAFNFAVFTIAMKTGVNIQTSNMIAYLVGGQVNFVGHDRYTYAHLGLPSGGWRARWVKFMSGQFAGFTTNSMVAALLVIVGAPALVIYAGAMVVSGALVFVWIRFFSHKAPPDSQPPPCVEH